MQACRHWRAHLCEKIVEVSVSVARLLEQHLGNRSFCGQVHKWQQPVLPQHHACHELHPVARSLRHALAG
jgi:hypothetical protein